MMRSSRAISRIGVVWWCTPLVVGACAGEAGSEGLTKPEACGIATEFVESNEFTLHDGLVSKSPTVTDCDGLRSRAEKGEATIELRAEDEIFVPTATRTNWVDRTYDLECFLIEFDQGWDVDECGVL